MIDSTQAYQQKANFLIKQDCIFFHGYFITTVPIAVVVVVIIIAFATALHELCN